MTCRKSKRHLEFESLETMELLSGAGTALSHAMAHHLMPQAHRGTRPSVGGGALDLSATVQGNYHVAGKSAVNFTGRGPINTLGNAHLQGKIGYGAAAGSGKFTLNFGKRGKVSAIITGQTDTNTYNYQIIGGTRTFAGDSGSGVAVVNILSASGGQSRGRFALTFENASSV